MAIELENSFSVPVPPAQAWQVLLDVERIGPCMPGAVVDEVAGDKITGRVTVKLGPVKLTYKGTATFTERNEESHSVAMTANGKETRGSGTAAAVVHAGLGPGDTDGSTLVTMHTSLNVTGKPAQFGRGVMADVSAKLIEQFAANLAGLLAAGSEEEATRASDATAETNAPDASGEAGGDTAASLADAAGVTQRAGEASVTREASVTQEAKGAGEADATGEATSPAAAPPPVQRQETLNIVRLAAVPVLKRLLPVAVLAGAVAFIFRWFRKLFRRAK